jgi:hypothetical protein
MPFWPGLKKPLYFISLSAFAQLLSQTAEILPYLLGGEAKLGFVCGTALILDSHRLLEIEEDSIIFSFLRGQVP